MIQPINSIPTYHKYQTVFKTNYTNSDNSAGAITNDNSEFMLEYLKNKDANEQKAKRNNYIFSFCALFAGIGVLLYLPKLLSKSSKKIEKDIPLQFTSLAEDKKIPTLNTCKSIEPKLKDFLQNQIDYAKASKEDLIKTGNPDADKRLLLFGDPGSGKSFFSKIFAKSLNADYMEIKYSDLNKRFCGEHIENMKVIFENVINTAQNNPDKKFVVNFNEIDALAVPINDLYGSSHAVFKKEERTTFLIFLEEAAEKAPNLVIIGSSNATPSKGLDEAVLSRFQNIMKINYPQKNLIYEALLAHIKSLPEGNNFIEKHKDELDKFASELYKRRASFRNLDNIVNESKNIYLRKQLKDKNSVYQMEYLNNAFKNQGMTDGEISKNCKGCC